MENTLKMPASYAVMNDEEMTYTDGGVNPGIYFAGSSIAYLAFVGLNIASYVQGVVASRKWYKNYVAEHPNSTTTEQFDAAIDALSTDINKGAWNAIRDVYRTLMVVANPVLSAIIILV
jgi:hypothetical protein